MDQTLAFGEFRLDGADDRLFRGECQVPLRRKSLGVLRYLARHDAQVVTREDIQREVWKGTHVSGTVVRVCIREIRAALGENPRAPRFLETIGSRGYRFTAERRPATQRRALVGRDRELRLLTGWFEHAHRGNRTVVFLAGEAGIGKTALVDLFSETVAAQFPLARWVRGQCVERFGSVEAFLPVHSALTDLCGEPVSGPSAKALLRRHAPSWLARMPALLTDEEHSDLRERTHGATHDRTVREIAEAIEALANDRTLVLVLEDLHWSDPSTVDLLSSLGRGHSSSRLLVLCTYRPEDETPGALPFRAMRQDLVGMGACHEVSLQLLSKDNVAEYLAQELEGQVQPDVEQLLHRRSGGHPLFMANLLEHLLSAELLVERGKQWSISSTAQSRQDLIPLALKQTIERRVECVDGHAQRALEVASVAGATFCAAAIAAGLKGDLDVVEDLLEELSADGGLIEEVGVTRWPDGTISGRYRFRHALYAEVLYQRLGAARRARLHRALGGREEAGYGEQSGLVAGVLAMHFERGQDSQAALKYLALAAESAAGTSSHREAIAYLERALVQLESMPQSAALAQEEMVLQGLLGVQLSMMRGYTAPEVERAFQRTHKLFSSQTVDARTFPALIGLATFYLVRAEYPRCLELLQAIEALATRSNEAELLLEARSRAGVALTCIGRFEESSKKFDDAIAVYQEDPGQESRPRWGQHPVVVCHAHGAWSLWLRGQPDKALRSANHACLLAESLKAPYDIVFALHYMALVRTFRQEYGVVAQLAARQLGLSQEHGFVVFAAGALMHQGAVSTENGAPEAGCSQLEQGLGAYKAVGTKLGNPFWYGQLAWSQLAAGRISDALGTLDQGLQHSNDCGEHWWEPELHRLRGLCLLRSENMAAAEAQRSFHRACEVAERLGASSLLLRALVSSLENSESVAARRETAHRLRSTYGAFTEGANTSELKSTAKLLAQL